MKKIFLLFLLFTTLSGCALFHVRKFTIVQGNIVTQEEIQKLHRGMSEKEVKDILGNPVSMNIFSENQLDYVYTLQAGGKDRIEKQLILIFQQGKLKDISTSGNL